MSTTLPTAAHATERFVIVRRLGAGGFGEVYEAIDREQKARVALKRLWQLSPEAILCFKREFRARQDVDHPNLVHAGELLEDRGEWLLTMELVEGTPWLRHVSHDPARIAGTVRQLASALVALHDADLVHCDVKPANVVVTPSGRAVLLDLGLVLGRDHTGQRSGMHPIGTAVYVAPEQAAGESVDAPADVYSLGVTLYEALAGHPPFEGEPVRVIMRKRTEDPPPPTIEGSALASLLARLTMRMLARDPAARPTARAVVVELDRALGRRLDRATPTSTIASLHRLPFVGREAALASLRGAMQLATAGRFASVLVEGESGLGKTRLVERFLATVDRPGLVALPGRCFDRESVPFNAFDGMFDALAEVLSLYGPERSAPLVPEGAGVLARMFPVLGGLPGFAGRSDARTGRARAFAIAAELFRRIGAQHPLVIVVDDFQWIDDESLELLRVLFFGEAPPNVCLVLASRPIARCREAVRLFVDALGEREGHDAHARLALGPLEGAAGRDLVSNLLGADASPELVDRIVHEARGEPLFVGELAIAARDGVAERSLPSVERAVVARTKTLESKAATVLQTIALAIGPIDESVCAAATGLDAPTVQRAIASLRAMRLVRTDRIERVHRVEMIHDRVRAAVRGEIPRAIRVPIHGRLADAMRAAGVTASEELAHHLLEAGLEIAAAEELYRAAFRAATSFALDRAARLYARSVALGLPEAEGASRALLVSLADAYGTAGQPRSAARALHAASSMAAGMEAARLAAVASALYARSGTEDLAEELFATASTSLGVSGPPDRIAILRRFLEPSRAASGLPREVLAQRVEAFAALAAASVHVHPDEALRFEVDALVAATELGDPQPLAIRLVRAALGELLLRGRGSPRARARIEQAAGAALDEPRALGLVQLARGLLLVLDGEGERATPLLDASIESLQRAVVDASSELVVACLVRAIVAIEAERTDDAMAAFASARQTADVRGHVDLGLLVVAAELRFRPSIALGAELRDRPLVAVGLRAIDVFLARPR